MDEPIDRVGDVQGYGPMQSTSAVTPMNASAQQLVGVLADGLAGYASQEQTARLLGTIRQLVDAGIPVKDVADAMYANAASLDALRDGDITRGAGAVAAWMTQNLNELRESGVPDDRLRFLTRSGFAVGEISAALRDIPGLRDELAQRDLSKASQLVQTMHDFFRENGRATHNDSALLTTADNRQTAALNNPNMSWFEQYMRQVRVVQRRFATASHPGDEDEVHLVVPLPTPPVEEKESLDFGAWIFAAIVAVALLVLVVSRC